MDGSKRAERTFTVTETNPETGEVDRNAVMAALGDIEATGHRLGGAWICTPVRRELAVLWDEHERPIRSEHRTIAWVFEFVKYVPAVEPPTPTATPNGEQAAVVEADRRAEEQAAAARDLAVEPAG